VQFHFNLLLLLAFVFAQRRITYRLLRLAARRLSPGVNTAVRGALALFNIALVAGYLLSYTEIVSYLGLPPRPAMYAGAMALTYFISATGAVVLLFLVDRLKRVLSSPEMDPGRRQLLDMAGLAVVASPIAVMGYGTFIQRTDFRIREIDMPLRGLGSDADGLRVLHLSDIHLSAFLSERELAGVIDAANELRPQLAIITGDLISSHGDPLDACLRQLGRVHAEAGMFGCLGNHERYSRAEGYCTAAAERLGIYFLRQENRVLQFGSGRLNLAGVDYQSMYDRPYLRGTEKLIVPGATNILLSHNPDVFPVAARQGYDLMLAGHTHGGQVTIEILDQSINPARFLTPFVYGLYRTEKAAAYVTRGIGTIGIPARIGAPPEITLLRLRKA
jgi:predicted MPP superfamily phosphohydrolase